MGTRSIQSTRANKTSKNNSQKTRKGKRGKRGVIDIINDITLTESPENLNNNNNNNNQNQDLDQENYTKPKKVSRVPKANKTKTKTIKTKAKTKTKAKAKTSGSTKKSNALVIKNSYKVKEPDDDSNFSGSDGVDSIEDSDDQNNMIQPVTTQINGGTKTVVKNATGGSDITINRTVNSLEELKNIDGITEETIEQIKKAMNSAEYMQAQQIPGRKMNNEQLDAISDVVQKKVEEDIYKKILEKMSRVHRKDKAFLTSLIHSQEIRFYLKVNDTEETLAIKRKEKPDAYIKVNGVNYINEVNYPDYFFQLRDGTTPRLFRQGEIAFPTSNLNILFNYPIINDVTFKIYADNDEIGFTWEEVLNKIVKLYHMLRFIDRSYDFDTGAVGPNEGSKLFNFVGVPEDTCAIGIIGLKYHRTPDAWEVLYNEYD